MKESAVFNNIYSKLGIEQLNPMQKEMAEKYGIKNVMLLSPTGSGKTLAFIISVLKNMRPSSGKVQCVVIAPSRELAIQIYKIFQAIASDYKVTCCYGGHNFEDEKKSLAVTPDIIVSTPGRLLDHQKRNNIDTYNTRILVLDEFDKSLELGFQDEMAKLVRRMPNAARHIFTSATRMQELPEFINIDGLEVVDYLKGSDIKERIKVAVVKSPEKDKLSTLSSLINNLENEGKIIVFVNYRESVERIYRHLYEEHFPVGAYHGGLEQIDREKAIYMLNNGTFKILVTTDLGSRGLDIQNVAYIIHYHLPVTEEVYTHRNGRTARINTTGSAFIIKGPNEKIPSYITDYEDYKYQKDVSSKFEKDTETLFFSAGKKEKISRGDILGFLTSKGELEASEVGKIDISDHYAMVAIAAGKVANVIKNIEKEKIKNKKVKISVAKQ